MDVRRIDLSDVINIGGSYADHLGIAQDVIKQGARLGLIEDSKAKRVLRMIDAQGESHDGKLPLFAADILAAPAIMENPQEFKTWFNALDAKGTKEQHAANAFPGAHGHHGNSVSSIAASGQDLPVRDHVRMINEINRNPAYADVNLLGTNREDMLPIIAAKHLHDREFNAHTDPLHDGVTNTGYWQTDQSYHDEMDPIKRAALVVDETLRPQQAMSIAAYQDPINQEALQIAADDLGITIDELVSVETNEKGKTRANMYRDALKKSGFDSKGMEKVLGMDRGRASTGTTSNQGVLDDRPGLSDNRVRMGMSGNLGWEKGADGALHTYLRSNNRRRRL